ncbi:MAG: GerMN domain-containing protein [Clostridiales bacterium]|nr:GerMN domain-containing protein [Clostridiales bacterium]
MKSRALVLSVIVLCMVMLLTGCTNPLSALRDFFKKKTAIINEEPVMDEIAEKEDLSNVTKEMPDGARATVLYYKDSENLLVPVMRYIPKGDMGIAKAAIKGMIYSPELSENIKPIGLYPTLPMGTEILGATIKEDGLAIIDFNENFLGFDSMEGEALGIKALVYTLTEFPNITSVQVKIEGEEIEGMIFGTKIGLPLKRSEINLIKPAKMDDKMAKVMVYYQKKGSGYYSYYVPLTKLVSGYTNSAEAALNALLEGPGCDLGLRNPFPDGTKILGVEVNDGIAFANFSEEILNLTSMAEERALTKAITLTLGELESISKVRLFVDGHTIENTESIGSKEYLDIPVFVNFYE